MSPSRNGQTGFTVTELMVVLVIIGVLAAIATPSLTRDSTARKGRDFANFVAQGLQRAHLDAMSFRVSTHALVCLDGMATYRSDQNPPMRSISAPPGVAIWDANVAIPSVVPGGPVLTAVAPAGCVFIYFNSMGNAGTSSSAANLATWNIYIRNENLRHNHPDGGFRVTVSGLTSFVSTRNFPFAQ